MLGRRVISRTEATLKISFRSHSQKRGSEQVLWMDRMWRWALNDTGTRFLWSKVLKLLALLKLRSYQLSADTYTVTMCLSRHFVHAHRNGGIMWPVLCTYFKHCRSFSSIFQHQRTHKQSHWFPLCEKRHLHCSEQSHFVPFLCISSVRSPWEAISVDPGATDLYPMKEDTE